MTASFISLSKFFIQNQLFSVPLMSCVFLWLKDIVHACFISNTFISNARTKLANQQMLSNTLWLNFCFLKIIHILSLRKNCEYSGLFWFVFSPSAAKHGITLNTDISRSVHQRYHPKVIGYILKNKQKDKCVCIHETIRLIVMKMKMKMENRSHICDINRPKPRYSKYRKCLNMSQHLKLNSWKS